ncbi:MAG TPA: hypothetical protein VIH18_13595 [Candidatus Binatia bacterium]
MPFHQIGHPPGPLDLCPLERVFQPPLLAGDILLIAESHLMAAVRVAALR